jgi:hypothetical protein
MRRPPPRSPAACLTLLLSAALASSALWAADNDPGRKPNEKGSKNPPAANARPAANGDKQPNPPKLTGEQKTLLRFREVLQAGDEEWAVLEPRIAGVLRLQRDASAGKEPKGPRPPRPERPADNPSDRPTPEVQARSRALNAALFDPSLPAAEIKARVAAVRDARAKVRQDLARAQDELRELLTYRQEATLIIMGVLE